jgi:hypothetical protein
MSNAAWALKSVGKTFHACSAAKKLACARGAFGRERSCDRQEAMKARKRHWMIGGSANGMIYGESRGKRWHRIGIATL